MKDLRTLLEASILDIEGTLSKKLDFIELTTSKTVDEYNALVNAIKNTIDSSSNRSYSSRGLKKESHIFSFGKMNFLMIILKLHS